MNDLKNAKLQILKISFLVYILDSTYNLILLYIINYPK